MTKPIDFLSAADKEQIRDFARGDQMLRGPAIAIHRAYISLYGLRRGDPYFDFMSEVDNPCPDLVLRARYRRQVLEGK